MLERLFILLVLLTAACSAPKKHSWQDTRMPAREDATIDLEYCRDFAARQYTPGMPAGVSYLGEKKTPSDPTDEYQSGEWRPDKNPTQQINPREIPRHDIEVEYTGYPGELDYYPNYLDDILEKCIFDRGWKYLPESPGKTIPIE